MKYTNRNQDCIFRWTYNTNYAIRINDSQHTSNKTIKACTQRRSYLPGAASQSTELGMAVVFVHLAASCLWSIDSVSHFKMRMWHLPEVSTLCTPGYLRPHQNALCATVCYPILTHKSQEDGIGLLHPYTLAQDLLFYRIVEDRQECKD